jgi:hypothetical protein
VSRRSTLLVAATALSLALHIALLMAPVELRWPESASLAPLEVTFIPPPPAAVQPPQRDTPVRPRQRIAKKPAVAHPAATVKSPEPLPEIVGLEEEPGTIAAPDTTVSESIAEPPVSAGTASTGPDPPAEYPVKRAELVYDLFHSSTHTRVGQVTHRWFSDGNHYEAESVAEAVGFFSWIFGARFVQRSFGRIGPEGLVPEAYVLERGGSNPPETARFDWADGKLALAWRDELRTVPLPQGAQDAMSVMHQIYFIKPASNPATLSVATSRKLSRYIYEILGDADLETPLGTLRTVHVGRVETDGSVLEIWLDKDRQLLPVRVYSMDRKGTVLDQVVRAVTLLE